MKKKNVIGLVIVFVFLLGAFPVFAQVTDFQKQMMQQMQKQMMQGGGTGQQRMPLTSPAPSSSILPATGKALFNDLSLGTNGKSCGSCHKEGQKPLDGRNVDNHLVAFIQYCYEHAIGGQKVIPSDKLENLVAYFRSLESKAPAAAPAFPFPGTIPQQQQLQQQPVEEEDSW